MARMLGRFQSPGCCPGMREGRYRTRRANGLDCSSGDGDTRWRKRVEQREFARSLQPRDEIPAPFDDLDDCAHGCNGDCLTSGSEVCSFTCHPGRTDQDASVEREFAEAAVFWRDEIAEFAESSVRLSGEALALQSADEDVRAYVSRLWADDWNSLEDQAYDAL